MIEVSSREAAWELAERLFPTNFEEDPERSKRAGYSIYFTTEAGMNAWISDLDDRLELNYPDGTYENIWIEHEGMTFGEFLDCVDVDSPVKIVATVYGVNFTTVHYPKYYLGLGSEDFALLSKKIVTRVFVEKDILCVRLES